MLTAIPAALRTAGYAVIALIVLAAGAYVWHLRSTVASQTATIAGLKTDVTKIAAINAQDAAAAKQAQAGYQASIAALTTQTQQAQGLAQALGSTEATIQAAPAAQQAQTVPPLVWSTIQGLKP